ncbi:hypothetical protein FRB90_003821, partial [Tulasnella sp. 427]
MYISTHYSEDPPAQGVRAVDPPTPTVTLVYTDLGQGQTLLTGSMIALVVVFGALAVILIVLVGVELWKLAVGRKPSLRISGIDTRIHKREPDCAAQQSVPLTTNRTGPLEDVPPTPTVIPPTPPPLIHHRTPTRTQDINPRSQGYSRHRPPLQEILRPQHPADSSSESLDTDLGEVVQGRLVSISLAPASLKSSNVSMEDSQQANNLLSTLPAVGDEQPRITSVLLDSMELEDAKDTSRDTGEFTILVSPPTPRGTPDSTSVHLPFSNETYTYAAAENSGNQTLSQVNSRHTLMLNDLSTEGAVYQRAVYDDADGPHVRLNTSQFAHTSGHGAGSYPFYGSLALPLQNPSSSVNEGRPASGNYYDRNGFDDPFRKSSPQIPPLAFHFRAPEGTIPERSFGPKVLSMVTLVQNLMATPRASSNRESQLTVLNTAPTSRSYFSPNSTIVPLPGDQEESFLERSTAVVRKVWKSTFGRASGRQLQLKGRREEEGDTELTERRARTRVTPSREHLLNEARNPARTGPREDLAHRELPHSDFNTPSRRVEQEGSTRLPMADSSNLSRNAAPQANATHIERTKKPPRSPRTPSKVHQHSRISSSPYFLQNSPGIVRLDGAEAYNAPSEVSYYEQPALGFSGQNQEQHRSASSEGLSFLLSSAGLAPFPEPPQGIMVAGRRREVSEFTEDGIVPQAEPSRLQQDEPSLLTPAKRRTSIYDDWNSLLPSTPRSLENMDPSLLKASLRTVPSPTKQVRSTGSSAHRESRGDGEVVSSTRADRDDLGGTAFVPSRTSTPLRSAGRNKPQ